MDLDKASKYSHIGTFILTAALFVLTAILVWPLVRPDSASAPQGGDAMTAMSLFVLAALFILIAAILNILATRNKRLKPAPNPPIVQQGIDTETHKKVIDKLNACESLVKHWQAEVGKEQLAHKEQVGIRDKRLGESQGQVGNLEQQLRVAQDKLDQFKTPRYRLKINRAEYTLLGKVGLDVTEVLDRMILDDRLVLDVPYNDIFRPDPWKHSLKHLIIDFSHGLKEFSVTVPENTKLTLPFPYDEISLSG